MSDHKQRPRGQTIAVDPNAVAADPKAPAFVARPTGAPVYYGFVVLPDVSADGFTLGKITDFESESSDSGDAFVIAPDDSRCGLVWEISKEEYFQEVCPLEESRWGVWAVSFPHPMNNRENARRNLEALLPKLRPRWEAWKIQFKK
jgi:hypothetical protein